MKLLRLLRSRIRISQVCSCCVRTSTIMHNLTMNELVFVSIFVIILIYLLQNYGSRRSKQQQLVDKLPGPKSYPFLGTLMEFLRSPRNGKYQCTYLQTFYLVFSYLYYDSVFIIFFFVLFPERFLLIEKLIQDYGYLFRTWTGPIPVVHVANPNDAEVRFFLLFIFLFLHSCNIVIVFFCISNVIFWTYFNNLISAK